MEFLSFQSNPKFHILLGWELETVYYLEAYSEEPPFLKLMVSECWIKVEDLLPKVFLNSREPMSIISTNICYKE